MHAEHLARCLVKYMLAIVNIISQDKNDFPALFSHENPLWHSLGLTPTEFQDLPSCRFGISPSSETSENYAWMKVGEVNLTLPQCFTGEGDCKSP